MLQGEQQGVCAVVFTYAYQNGSFLCVSALQQQHALKCCFQGVYMPIIHMDTM